MVGTGPPSSSSSSMFTAWIAAMSRIDFTNSAAAAAAAVNSTSSSDSMPDVRVSEGRDSSKDSDNQAVGYSSAQLNLGFRERAFSAAGAAFLSAIIVNPLDVVKTRMQAQAAGAPYYPHAHENLRTSMATLGENTVFAEVKCPPVCPRGGAFGMTPLCPPSCFQYKGTLDVFYKIIRQEGISRLWRGTNAGLALAIPTVGIYLPCYDIFRDWLESFTSKNAPQFTPYAPLVAGSIARSLACITCSPIELARTRMQAQKGIPMGVKPPGILKTLFGVLSVVKNEPMQNNFKGLFVLWTGVGAQLARDVPFSAICWSTLEPVRRHLLTLVGDEANGASILGANFSAGFIAGSIAAAATCPLDVAKTRRQIEKDPMKAMKTSTMETLMKVWRDGGVRGLFMGVGPRVGRAGPSVGIVVSFYEVVKHLVQQRQVAS